MIGITDAARASSAAALHDLGIEVVMLTGDNQATADRIAGQLSADSVIAEVLPGDKAAKIAELQAPPTRPVDTRQLGPDAHAVCRSRADHQPQGYGTPTDRPLT